MSHRILGTSSDRQTIAVERNQQVAVERMENRRLMSVSASVLAGPVNIAGNTWTYSLTSPGEATGTETLTSKGVVTRPNGQQEIEVDVVYASAGFPNVTGTNYYGFTSQGYVEYEDSTIASDGTINDTVESPPEVLIPDTLTAASPVTSPTSTETNTVNLSNGSATTTTDTVMTTDTLTSETPSVPISAAGKSFTCYELDQTQTNTDTTDSSNTTTDMSQSFIDPTYGLVQLNDVTNGTVLKLTNFTGSAFHLAVTTVTSALVDDNLNPTVQVSIVDATGAIDTNAADAATVTVAIAPASTGTGTLSGTSTVTTSGGVATFSGLTINKPGQYVLQLTDSTGRTVSTPAFQVAAGKLIFKKSIENGIAGSVLKPVVEIELVNSKGKTITDAPSLVTLGISGTNSSNPITGNTAELVRGVALFSSVKLAAEGEYTLTATDGQGDTNSPSNQFDITGLHLAFAKQPPKVGIGGALRYVIEVKDFRNRKVNVSSIGLGFTLDTSQGDPNAVLNNPADTVDFGVANNSDRKTPVSISSPGTYTITAMVISQSSDAFDTTIQPITSDPIDVVANHLVFSKQPLKTVTGLALKYEIVVKDYKSELIKSDTDQLNFTLISQAAGSSAKLAGGSDKLIGGTAINALNMLSIDTAGTYKLTVVDVPAAPGDPVAQAVTSDFFVIRPVK